MINVHMINHIWTLYIYIYITIFKQQILALKNLLKSKNTYN